MVISPPIKASPKLRINLDSNEYRIETRQGFYSPAERIGSYNFPEKFNCSFKGAKVYDRVELRREVKKLKKRSIDLVVMGTPLF